MKHAFSAVSAVGSAASAAAKAGLGRAGDGSLYTGSDAGVVPAASAAEGVRERKSGGAVAAVAIGAATEPQSGVAERRSGRAARGSSQGGAKAGARASSAGPGTSAADAGRAAELRGLAISAAKGAAADAASRVAGVAAESGHRASGAAVELGGLAAAAAKVAAADAASKACSVTAESKLRANETFAKLKATLTVWAKQKAQRQIERAVDKIPGVAKRMLEDEQMPRAVSRSKDRLVDSLWPDVRTEILWEVAVALDRAEAQPEEEQEGVDACRAFFRYHLYPYDRSFWGNLRDPFWVVFNIVPLIPVFGIYPAWFFFVFLVIDKSDEFQLIQYILSFKGMAFISQGVLRAVIGFGAFLVCVTGRADDREHDCDERGPGSHGSIWPTTIGFVAQVVLVWVAFLLLRCSGKKGRSTLKGTVSVQAEGHATVKGGYIIYFLWYDLVAFLLCLGIVAFAVSTRPKYKFDDWPVHHAVFAAQVLYGIISMPFFLFTLPVLQRMLTHAMPTAYNRKGVCCRRVPPPRLARPQVEEVVTDGDVADLYARIKGVLPIPG